ncbi:MAG: hypothetical protein ACK5X3_20450 [Pseudomonadota bacterium]
MTASTYTLEEDARILAYRRDGVPWAVAAQEMGRTSQALQGRYKQMRARAALGHPRAPLRDADTEQFPERCQRHADALLAAAPRGFPALSEKRVGRGGLAACLPLIWPLDNL